MVRFHWRDVSAFGDGRDDVEHWGEDNPRGPRWIFDVYEYTVEYILLEQEMPFHGEPLIYLFNVEITPRQVDRH